MRQDSFLVAAKHSLNNVYIHAEKSCIDIVDFESVIQSKKFINDENNFFAAFATELRLAADKQTAQVATGA